jgi:hypothetical protein
MLLSPAEVDGKNRNHAPESCRENGSGVRASIMMGWERAVSDMEERESRRESGASVW